MVKNKTLIRKLRGIPEGPYCYTILKIESGEGGLPVIKTKPCAHYRHSVGPDGEIFGRCRLLKRGDNSKSSPTSILFDGCKECGLKNGDEE